MIISDNSIGRIPPTELGKKGLGHQGGGQGTLASGEAEMTAAVEALEGDILPSDTVRQQHASTLLP